MGDRHKLRYNAEVAEPALSLGAWQCALSKKLFQLAARVCPAHSPVQWGSHKTDQYTFIKNLSERACAAVGDLQRVDVGHVQMLLESLQRTALASLASVCLRCFSLMNQ